MKKPDHIHALDVVYESSKDPVSGWCGVSCKYALIKQSGLTEKNFRYLGGGVFRFSTDVQALKEENLDGDTI